jgi:transposase
MTSLADAAKLRALADHLDPAVATVSAALLPTPEQLREIAAHIERIHVGGNPEAADTQPPPDGP